MAIPRTIMLLVFTLTVIVGYSQKIFQADSPAEAQVKVFAVEDPDEADLWVCFVWEEVELTRTGLWMDMRFAHEADVIIFFVDEEKGSDLKIWLVDTIEESKWIKNEKKKLLSIKKEPK
ncbi:MAG: hypothetical protein CVT98_03090 [Bacteroidetes bacterium HGW-Bacteroidetes-15]|nr:MAG: hypothetical protein CVT98_03090 [Bacteroidetes bacterium HGW-Bacteroidetes-15]